MKKLKPAQHFQLNIFDGLSDDLRSIQRILSETDINTLTPVEALMTVSYTHLDVYKRQPQWGQGF